MIEVTVGQYDDMKDGEYVNGALKETQASPSTKKTAESPALISLGGRGRWGDIEGVIYLQLQ